jgi:hypothetical protein
MSILVFLYAIQGVLLEFWRTKNKVIDPKIYRLVLYKKIFFIILTIFGIF